MWKCHFVRAKDVALTLLTCTMYSDSSSEQDMYIRPDTNGLQRMGQGNTVVSSAAQELLQKFSLLWVLAYQKLLWKYGIE